MLWWLLKLHLRVVYVSHLLATDEPHEVATELTLDRFIHGKIIDEKGVGAQPKFALVMVINHPLLGPETLASLFT